MKFLIIVCALMTVWAYAADDVVVPDPMAKVSNDINQTEGTASDVYGTAQTNVKKDHEIPAFCPLCAPQQPLAIDPEGQGIVPADSKDSATSEDIRNRR